MVYMPRALREAAWSGVAAGARGRAEPRLDVRCARPIGRARLARTAAASERLPPTRG